MKLLVITASVREGRAGKNVAEWFTEQANINSNFEVETLDLKELGLSYELPEQLPGSVENGEYSTQEDRDWAQKINSVDAVAFVSPEYNHGYPASLKNAIDHLLKEWEAKPVAFIGYGAAGAPFSYQAFELVATQLKMNVTEDRVGISEIWAAFNEDGELVKAEEHNKQAQLVLSQLAAKVTK
ncbi:NAD(P)H-dependent oxidoreductase [Candidatus Saccharibacteria bacterium]|nr:NAD(P)H-dependent oxidoreductase [Candidatus Saccharibacteria bacterium]